MVWGVETGGNVTEVLRVSLEAAGYADSGPVVRDIGFGVNAGELIGLIGPNGAGKSTTIKGILGLLKEVKGEIAFPGPRGLVSYIPEHPVTYEELTLWEHMELAAAAYDISPKDLERRGQELLHRFRMDKVRHHLPGSFSKGMQQKMMLIIGFLLEPDIYIVDEPFIGLDPKAARDFLELLEQERRRGAGVLMSTHVLDTAEKICDSFLLMEGGRLAASGTLEQIRDRCGMPGASLFDCFLNLT